MSNSNAFPAGTKVKVATRWGGNPTGLAVGATYTVESCRTAGLQGEQGFQVRLEGVSREYGTDWFVLAEAPADREYIPFSLTKDTSKEYALRTNSRLLDEEQRLTLDKAAKGQEVDAWAFHSAVTAALSLAATRAGQSMARREYTKMARHLLYISGAVIENSLRGLPPVDPGTRSPKIAEQKREIDDLRATVQRLAAAEKQLADALSVEKMRTAEIVVEKTDLELQVKRQARVNSRKSVQMDYALSLLDEPSKFKVIGFGDAVSWIEA